MKDFDLNCNSPEIDLSNASGASFNPCKHCPFGLCSLCTKTTTSVAKWRPKIKIVKSPTINEMAGR